MAAIYWPYVKCDQYFIAIVLQLGWQDSILLQGKVHTYMYIRGVLGHPQEITLGHPAASKMLTARVPQNYFLRVLLNAPYICVYVIFNLTQNYFLFPIISYVLPLNTQLHVWLLQDVHLTCLKCSTDLFCTSRTRDSGLLLSLRGREAWIFHKLEIILMNGFVYGKWRFQKVTHGGTPTNLEEATCLMLLYFHRQQAQK